MCGICGFVGIPGDRGRDILRQMNSQIVRRGPDGEGEFFSGHVGLAMRRLAIIDPVGAQQPIFNESRSACVVFNGEIYNYKELRKDLASKGHRFSTEGDTEVIVHLYDEYGADLARHLQGMFAFAIWDLRNESLLLGRDRFGIKPLYLARIHGGLIFGSEIKSILSTGVVSKEIDPQAVDEYLTYTNIPCPRTIYKDVSQVDPGTTLVFRKDGSLVTQRFWFISARGEEKRSEEEWIIECERSLRTAVESHLVSDVPVGAFLSGGVDSGLLVALMADMTSHPVETFTVGFEGSASSFIDERIYARKLVSRYGLKSHEVNVTPNFEEIVWEIADAFDQPFADDSVVPSYYVCKAASKHVKVAMTGLGGDELFGGYRRHLGLQYGEALGKMPGPIVRGIVGPLVHRLPESSRYEASLDHLKRFIRSVGWPASLRYQDSLASIPPDERRMLCNPEFFSGVDQLVTERIVTLPYSKAQAAGALSRALLTDLETYLMDDVLALSDRISMWHSLELRVPYLDHRFVEFAFRVPERYKIRFSTQKYLLKKVAERWLPKDMIYHKKQGFEAPMAQWLKGPLLPFFDSLVNRSTLERMNIFNADEVIRLRNDHVRGVRKNSKILFSILMFCVWYRRCVEPDVAT